MYAAAVYAAAVYAAAVFAAAVWWQDNTNYQLSAIVAKQISVSV